MVSETERKRGERETKKLGKQWKIVSMQKFCQHCKEKASKQSLQIKNSKLSNFSDVIEQPN